MIRNDLECDILDEFYLKATRILYKTRPLLFVALASHAQINEKYSVYVQTNVNYPLGLYTFLNQSNQFIFDYVTPQLMSIEPRKGIKSGGTLLKITGKYLSCGSDQQQQQDERIFKRNINAHPNNDQDLISYEVKIQIGKYLTRTIGLLKYEKELFYICQWFAPLNRFFFYRQCYPFTFVMIVI